ncbi:MAG: Slp family lipoprotein [Desulfatitalea sp.]|nr:Slp family lipoprotein [Desulfatitalea sp.]
MLRNLKVRWLFWACAILVVSGCAAGISTQARSEVTVMEPFGELQQNAERYIGETVMLGGKIIETQVQDNSTELTVLQLELDRGDRPQAGDQSAGRYLVRSDQFLDPALYSAGTIITVVGRLVEQQERLIGSMPYRYPVIVPIEIKKWPEEQPDRGPRFHFGFGVGTRF